MNDEKCLGYVQIVDLGNLTSQQNKEAGSLRIRAHENSLNIIELNNDGSILATSSERGTLIRLFETTKGTPLQELRRGSDRVNLFSLSFSFNDNWLACIGDSGTLHIFSVNAGKKEQIDSAQAGAKKVVKNTSSKNNKSLFGKLGFGAIFSYFDSEFSFAHFKNNNFDCQTKAIFLDNKEDKVLLLSYKGDCCKLDFDHNYGGECSKPQTTKNLLSAKD